MAYTRVGEWDAHYAAGKGWRRVIGEELAGFEEHVGPAAGRRLLDVGCGDGGYAAALHGLGYRVLGVDYAPAAIDTARSRHGGLDGLGFAVLDIGRDDPAKLGQFDVVTCRLVYAFLDRPRFLQTARTLLAPRGILHVTTPHMDRYPDPERGRRIGLAEDAIEALRHGWAASTRYDIDHLTCVVCRAWDLPTAV